MMHKEMKKTQPGNIFSCGLFLVLVFQTFVVRGTIYSNGLTRYGRNVCAADRSKSVSKSIMISTVNYQTYTTKCGWWGWGRCKRSRPVTGYYYRKAYQSDYDTYLSCCSGWRRSGSTCPIAICRSGCNNGGTCVSPSRCRCTNGWTGSTCSLDINECSSNNGGCQQSCVNRQGAERMCACYKGYISNPLDKESCIDVNECHTANVCSCTVAGGRCGANCTNTVGSFSCSCGKGYSLQSGTICTDNDECAVHNGGCSRQCVNYPGGFRCTCPRGFRLVSSKLCKDVNECASNNGNCEHTCKNLFGSHRCKCNEGFMLDSNGRTCSDIDECKLGHDCEDYCNNTLGGYFCSCRKGYELTSDNRTCADIDECARRSITGSEAAATLSACHHICRNVEGSFHCSCREGYALMYDKKQCNDIDECQTGSHSCEQNCLNTDGNYRCTCKPGYKLSSGGKTCEAQPCVQIDPPSHGGMTCSGLVTDTNCTFSCNPGYDLVGSQSRTCLPSSSWSGYRTSCKAKHCEDLTTTLESQTLSVPCFKSLGSTCYFGCRQGFFLQGDRQANCSLDSKGDAVSWNIGNFSCEEIKTCQPNQCRHEGTCLALDERKFNCNCQGTGYKGNRCQTGFVTTPIFPKLRTDIRSENLFLLARPLKRLKVSLYSGKGVTFEPPSMEMQFLKTKELFTVEVNKPGIRAITYSLEGENKDDFETPERGVLFTAPEILPNNSLKIKLFLPKGELPIGCEEHYTKEKLSCEIRLLSTAPWTGTPRSTNGIVHLATANNQTIPLSLIGLNLKDAYVSRDKMIEAGIAKTSSSKEFSLSHLRNGRCHLKVGNSKNLLELIENDAFVSSFLHALSEMAPEWLTLAVSETNEAFDIPNIAVNLASDLEHCSGFPLNQASSLAYYRPAVNYKLRVAQNEVPLFADGRTCFAINICKTGLFINFGKEQAELLKGTLDVFQHMKDSGLDLQVDSIGLFKEKETANFVKAIIWNGIKLQQLSPFEYNMWLKGSLEWKMKTPEQLFVTFKVTGETIIKSENIDSLFTDRMFQRMEMQLKGKAFVNITGRALKKYFALEFSPTAITGKAVLGGRKICSKNAQGIFLTSERSASTLLNESPFSAYVRPTKTEPVRLAILASLSGGRQNKILNIGEVKLFLNYLNFFVPVLQNVLLEANLILPEGKIVLKGSLQMMQDLNYLMREMDIVVAGKRINGTQALTLFHRINSKMEYLKKILDLITERSLLSSDNATFADCYA